MNSIWEYLLSSMTIIKDLVTTIALIIGAIVAILGLRTWRKQLKGNTEYDLARRILRALYKVRDAISSLRNPFIDLNEMIYSMKEAGIEININSPEFHNLSEGVVYKLRWNKVHETWSELELEILEAESLFGSQAKDIFTNIRKCVISLSVALDLYLRYISNPNGTIIDATHLLEIKKTITVFATESEKDKYADELSEAISDIEIYFRQYLKL